MQLKVRPGRVSGELLASPSKSYSHRAMTLALLADGASRLRRPLLSGDTLATLAAIEAFGAKVERIGDDLVVNGGTLRCPDNVIDAANSGTTIRIMAGVASLIPCYTVLTGDSSIRRRPMQPLIDALNQLGVECHSTQGKGLAPLIVKGPNKGTEVSIPGDVSSQFISSLLISSPLKECDTDIHLTTELKSRPYVEMTIEMMAKFGAKAATTKDGFHVPGGQRYSASDYTIPGDYSSAAFPLAAGALTGSATVNNLDPRDPQGDKVVLDILKRFGAKVTSKGGSFTVSKARLKGAKIDLGDAPDLFPIVAVVATQAEGESLLVNAEHVRHKESDRISTTTEFLSRMGAEVEERKDGCAIKGPCRLHGASIDPRDDHRILMAAAVAALMAEGETVIGDGDCFKISYPGFVEDMRSLGADLELK
ncbi:MAG: 3-phosphoshikimate 1-carboxyvinyltransferase [Methanomassiliicoccales archaeon PtaU1.Bin124]|nr:MAG: 3-phosphoshikimate 1-carboxyvinyltransferase [Methanomassiliicoccales archaeon PtaU1.Bin124]